MNLALILQWSQLFMLLPAIVRAAEAIHGGPVLSAGKGAEKLTTAINLAGAVAPAVIQAIETTPAEASNLQRAITATVAGLNAAGQWKTESIAP